MRCYHYQSNKKSYKFYHQNEIRFAFVLDRDNRLWNYGVMINGIKLPFVLYEHNKEEWVEVIDGLNEHIIQLAENRGVVYRLINGIELLSIRILGGE